MTRYFEVLQRDGAARIGKLLIGESTQTPYIIDTRTLNSKESLIVDAGSVWELGSFKAAEEELKRIWDAGGKNSLIILPHQSYPPEVQEGIKDKASSEHGLDTDGPTGRIYRPGSVSSEIDMYVMEGAGCFENNARQFFNTLLELKKNIVLDSAVYAPNICLPENLAMLVYLGIDILDNTKALVAAHSDIFLTTAGRFYLDSLAELPCRCEACAGTTITDIKDMKKGNVQKYLKDTTSMPWNLNLLL